MKKKISFKKKIAVSVCSLSLLTGTSLAIALATTSNNSFIESVNEAKIIADILSTFNEKYFIHEGENVDVKTKEAIKEVGDYVNRLNSENSLKSLQISSNSIVFTHNSGITFTFTPGIENSLGTPTKYALNKASILTAQPFEEELRRQSEAYENLIVKGANYIAAEFSSFVTYPDSQKTMNERLDKTILSQFGPNQVILLQGHGTWFEKLHSTILTGVDFDWNAYVNDPEYRDDVINQRITIDVQHEAVTYKYIDKYVGDLTNTFIYLGMCQTCKDDVLVRTFLDKGATAVIANTETTDIAYNDNMICTLSQRLSTKKEDGSHYNLSEALAYAKSIHGETDPSIAKSRPTLFGDGTYQVDHQKVVPYINSPVYDGKEHRGIEEGIGYTFVADEGNVDSAINHRNYDYYSEVKLIDDYLWSDGSNENVGVSWNIQQKVTDSNDVKLPTAKTNLIFTNRTVELINKGESNVGTFLYRLGKGMDAEWTETVPTATAVGTYEVYYVFEGDINHTDIGAQNSPVLITVTISENPTNVTSLIITIVLIVVFIALIVLVIYLSKRRKKKDNEIGIK